MFAIELSFDAFYSKNPPSALASDIREHFRFGMSTEDKKTLIKELLGVKND